MKRMIVVGLVSRPSREGWPSHAEVSIDGFSSPPIFSFGAGALIVEIGLKKRELDFEEKTDILKRLKLLDLPLERTRFDRLAMAFARDPLLDRKIGRIMGFLPPEEGSDPAHFGLCIEGELCGLGAACCKRYPKHGRIWIANLKTTFGALAFSLAQVRTDVESGMSHGFFNPDEYERILKDATLADLDPSETRTRYDRLMAFNRLDVCMLQMCLDIESGYYAPWGQARAERLRNGRCVLLAFDRLVIGEIVNREQGAFMLDASIECGLIAQRDYERVSEEISRLPIPQTTWQTMDELWESVGDLLKPDPRDEDGNAPCDACFADVK